MFLKLMPSYNEVSNYLLFNDYVLKGLFITNKPMLSINKSFLSLW